MQNLIFKIGESIRKRELAIFCGAGISWNSGLPLADELKRFILDKLPLNAADRDEIMASALPFEAFIETLSENMDISKLLDIFGQGISNANHTLIAHMAKTGYLKTVATTNFDMLIERSLEKEGLIRDKDFRVYYDEGQFSEIDFENIGDGILRLFKLHGTVEARESIRTTLKAVASRTLSEKRMNLIRYLFSSGGHRKVLILGYSCSDEFDITPQMQSLDGSQKEIIFIDHSKEEEKTEDIKTKDDKNPFKKFTGDRVICNTDKFMEKLWESLRQEKYELISSQAEWAKFVEEWATGLEKEKGHLKYSIAGFIFYSISNFKRAIEYRQRALEIAKVIGDKALEARCYGNLGNAYYSLGDFRRAIEYQQQALKIAKAIGHKEIEGLCYINLGEACYKLGDFKKSIEYYLKAEIIFKKTKQLHFLKEVYQRLPLAYKNIGDNAKAEEYDHIL